MSDHIPEADDAPTAPRSMFLLGLVGQLFTLLGEGRNISFVLIYKVGDSPPRVGLQGKLRECRRLLRYAGIELDVREEGVDDYISEASEVSEVME